MQPDQTTALRRRLKNIVGQLTGIDRMLEASHDCFAVLPQLKAARAALDKTTALFLQANLSRCLAQKKLDPAELEKLLLAAVRG